MGALIVRAGMQMGLAVALLGLMVLPLLEPETPEFTVDLLGVLFALLFVLLMWRTGRRLQKREEQEES